MHALMDETLQALTEQVEAFCRQVIAPRAAEIDQSNAFPRDLWPAMGIWGCTASRWRRSMAGWTSAIWPTCW